MVAEFDPETLVRHESPVNPRVYGEVALVTLLIGGILVAFFMLHEVTVSKIEYKVRQQAILSLVASVFLGVGFVYCL